jgi:hypothetical protein
MFVIRSNESLKIIQTFRIGSFWTIRLPLKLIYRKKALLFVIADVLFTPALHTWSFKLE